MDYERWRAQFKKKEWGLAFFAAGCGILLGIFLPPLGWMIMCGVALIICGIMWFKNC